jgi:twitching motility protein PilT
MEPSSPVIAPAGLPAAPPSPDTALSMKGLFEEAVRTRASDLLITAQTPPLLRIDGDLRPLGDHALSPDETRRLVFSLLNETQQEAFERKKELDFSLSVSGMLRFRANVYAQKGWVAAAFRLVPRLIPSLRAAAATS